MTMLELLEESPIIAAIKSWEGLEKSLKSECKVVFVLFGTICDIDQIVARIKDAGVEVLHEIREYPWGQRVFRFYDPDGHIIELSEAMDYVAGRFLAQGMTPEETAERTTFPLEVILAIKAGMGL